MRARLSASALLCIAVACGDFGSSTSEPPADGGVSANASDAADDTSPALVRDAGPDAACTGCAPEIVAPEIPHPYRIAAAGGALFWSDFTKDLWTCDPAACVPQPMAGDAGTLLKSHIGATSGTAGAIDTTCSSANDRTAGEYVYARDGGTVATRGVACPQFVSTHGNSILFTNSGTIGTTHTDWSITRCDANGACADLVGSTVPLTFGILQLAVSTGTKIIGATTNGTMVQWNDPPGATAPTAEPLSTTFRDLATDGTRVFWLDGSSVRGCKVQECAATAGVIAADATAQVLAADETGLYWTSKGSGPGDGKVMWLAPGTMTAVAIVTGQVAPVGIAVDATHVYWANESDAAGNVNKGSLSRRAKPL